MNNAPLGFRFDPQDLRDPRAATEALAHWDELAPDALSLLAHHPVHGPRLAMLRSADGWLADQAAAARERRGVCPSAEALYDFGRGPGYTPLTHAARAVIDRHLSHCQDCELLVESLVAPPPAPLELDYVESAHESEGDSGSRSGELETVGIGGGIGSSNGVFAHEAKTTSNGAVAHGAKTNGTSDHRAKKEAAASSTTVRESKTEFTERVRAARSRSMRRWVPMAAAASLLVAASVWTVVHNTQSQALRFPESPLLRGSATGSLLFPRDRVLHATPELVKLWPAFGERLTFEIQAAANAEGYWIDVSKHDGSAFAANTPLWKQSDKSPTLSALTALGPGHYTWEAWALVHGLDRQLGARDFEVVDDTALQSKLLALASQSEPERTLEAVRLLHENGFATDARRLARSMPTTPERDAYLEQVPGR